MEYKCKGCGKHPNEIGEYIHLAKEMNMTPDQVVHSEEGTFNPRTGLFYCTMCYVKAGMPLGTA